MRYCLLSVSHFYPHSSPHTPHRTLPTAHSSLHIPHCTPFTALSSLHTPHPTHLTPHSSPHTPHHTLLTTHPSLHIPHRAPFTAHSSPLTTASPPGPLHIPLHPGQPAGLQSPLPRLPLSGCQGPPRGVARLHITHTGYGHCGWVHREVREEGRGEGGREGRREGGRE